MPFNDMDIDKGDEKYLRIKAGESVQFHILSEEPTKIISHWVNKKKIICTRKNCELCEQGDTPRQGWKIQVLDRKTNAPKEFEFGTQIAQQIKTIAEILVENHQTMQDVDLRIKRVGAGLNDTEYFVNQVPKKEVVIAGPLSKDDDNIPF